MCDILAISAGYNYTPKKYLPIFAEKGSENMNGWGIGFFREDQALVEKSAEQVFSDQQVHESFQRLARIIDSRIIIAHLNCPKSGGRHSAQLHPFKLTFLDHDWLFAQIGVVESIAGYCSTEEQCLEADVYTARIFEYLRDQLVLLNRKNPYISVYISLRIAIQKLLEDYPGDYTFFLANESFLFAFCNFRQLMVLKESESMGDILLVTSVREGLSRTDWHPITPDPQSQGELLVIAGPDVLYAGEV
ncbi:MAG: class II glutamine amidotransferase [Deltaproteobacteria bacterium]|jgi:predicted glutamine amidotransferase|nr:class II glutamine amidotransferase [Deltaproteobacteria bacterium]MBW2571583.1 class II glutamine amidotransferase [Deltaproteobacteria bacterium]MBW2668341.1 class II glutamine amidotransferase [Deltaproteobacteria bacterium]